MRLFIAEKPSVAKAIAACLPGHQHRGEGSIECGSDVVTWCFGHLMEQVPPEAYDEKYKKWSWDTLPIVPAQWRLEVKADAKKQFAAIKALLKKATEVVNCGDADREGEMLVREVLDDCGYKGPLKRLWLSAMDEASVKKALSDLRPGAQYDGLYASAVARSRADWLVGMNLSRAYTMAARNAGHEGTVSVGRVQTPTLALIVNRDLSIDNFKPTNFYTIDADIQHANGNFTAALSLPENAPGTDPEGRLIDASIAQQIASSVSGKPGQIVKFEQKAGKKSAPLPFSLSALQQACSAKFGMSAQQVLDTAQSLYETHKITSYPRTDCGYLPESLHAEAPGVLRALVSMGYTAAGGADKSIKSGAFRDAKVTAHHGIIPNGQSMDLSGLTDVERKVYDLIAKHFIAQFYPDYTFQSTSVDVKCGEHIFKASGSVPVAQGWRTVFGNVVDDDDKDENNQALPQMVQNDPVTLTGAKHNAKQTKPSARFTDGTLIAAMTAIHKYVTDPEVKKRLRETSGIGTEATRAGIIETLLKRGFIEKKGKNLISTATGKTVIKTLGAAPVADAGMTALFEQALEMIVEGKLSGDQFLQMQVTNVTKQIESAKAAKFDAIVQAGSAHKCPKCGKPLRQRKGANGVFWGCVGYPDCKTSFPDVKGKPDLNFKPKPKAK